MDAINLFGHSMFQILLYDEIEMWHGHPDLYMNKLEDILNAPDDSNICYFVEVDLKYSDKIREKTKNCPFCPEKKYVMKMNLVIIRKKQKLILIFKP